MILVVYEGWGEIFATKNTNEFKVFLMTNFLMQNLKLKIFRINCLIGVKPDLVETLLVGHFWSDQIWSSIFGRAHIWSNPYLLQTHIWSEPFLVQPNLVGAIFGPTRFGRCHIWSIQIWLVYT